MKQKLILLLLFLTFSVRAYAEAPISEDSLKAAYIYHFLNFTDWQDDLKNYYVCIPDNDSLRESVEDILKGKTVNSRGIVVLSNSKVCHVLVSDEIPTTENVLTIGSLSRGSLLEFRVVDNKLKFAINLEKIKKSRLKISSQLLKLAILDRT